MEPYDNITDPLVKKMSSDEDKYFNIPTNRTVKELQNIIEKKYSYIFDINFEKKENNQNFWFISKNKEEPRIADRFEEHGSDLEQPLAIARGCSNSEPCSSNLSANLGSSLFFEINQKF